MFAVGAEASVNTTPIKALCWVIVIACDIILFMYRMSQLSSAVYRYVLVLLFCLTL